MKLKRIERLPSMKLSGAIPGDLADSLTAYGRYYHEVHGEAIKTWTLVMQIVRTFVDDDRAFQAWRRRNNGSPADAPAGSENGAPTESRNGSR